MKIIFVTIKEFLANGGQLELGRTIYREERRHFEAAEFDSSPLLVNSTELGEYIGENKERGYYLVKNNAYHSMPITETVGYVKININAQYK